MKPLASAPGKLILAGEHSVLHGAHALAIAVNRHTYVALSKATKTVLTIPKINIDMEIAKAKYIKRLKPISQAIDHLISLTDNFSPCHIKVHTELPVGSGMGSSASVFSSLCLAWAKHFKLSIDLNSLVELFENFAHHRASPVDSHTVIHGGAWLFSQNNRPKSQNLELTDWYTLNTGNPSSSTADCVKHTIEKFEKNPELANQMDQTTLALCQAIKKQNIDAIHQSIRSLHQDLIALGVVPQSCQATVRQLEKQGMSAKISGAGSIEGEQAGLLLVYSPHPHPLDFTLEPIQLCDQGARSC